MSASLNSHEQALVIKIQEYLSELGCKVEYVEFHSKKHLRVHVSSKIHAFTIASSLNNTFSHFLIRSSLLQPNATTEMYYMHIDSVNIAIYFPVNERKERVPRLMRKSAIHQNIPNPSITLSSASESKNIPLDIGGNEVRNNSVNLNNSSIDLMSNRQITEFSNEINSIYELFNVKFPFNLHLWYYFGLFALAFLSSFEIAHNAPIFFHSEYILFVCVYLFLPHVIKFKDALRAEKNYMHVTLPRILNKYSDILPHEYLTELKSFCRANKKMVKIDQFLDDFHLRQRTEQIRREFNERIAKETGDYWWKTQRGLEFERNLSVLLSRLGGQIVQTPGSADGGVDLYASWVGLGTLVIQCKGWNSKVGIATVRELVGVLHSLRDKKPGVIYVGVLAAPNGVTQPAASFSKANSIVIWSADQLVALARNGNSQTVSDYFKISPKQELG